MLQWNILRSKDENSSENDFIRSLLFIKYPKSVSKNIRWNYAHSIVSCKD